MYKEIAKLILYRDLGEDSILLKLSGIFRDYELDLAEKENLTSRIYEQMKALLDLSTQYGFDKNLWHNYLAYFLITDENPFSITCEKIGANDGRSTILQEMILLPSKICLNMIFPKLKNLWELTVLHRFPIIVPLRKKS